jgi:hypothetical protein
LQGKQQCIFIEQPCASRQDSQLNAAFLLDGTPRVDDRGELPIADQHDVTGLERQRARRQVQTE